MGNGRWLSYRLLHDLASRTTKSFCPIPAQHIKQFTRLPSSKLGSQFHIFRLFSSFSSSSAAFDDEFDYGSRDSGSSWAGPTLDDDEDAGKIPVKAYFLSTSINLKRLQAENARNVVPLMSRTSNYVALRFWDLLPEETALEGNGRFRHMLIFQYGSAVLFNVEEHEVESFLDIVRRHASGLLSDIRKDDYVVKEKPTLAEHMQGGPDYIVLKNLDTDSIRIIGSVLGQSIALDYFVSQVDDICQEFTHINRGMEKTGTFTMNRKKLFQLVGRANSNLADVILKVGLFDRSEIAWREAKYAQVNEYMREEYEVAQRFGNLDFKLKFVEHNIHFLQEVLQNRKSDFLEWCIIFLLTIDNLIAFYEIIRESSAGSVV